MTGRGSDTLSWDGWGRNTGGTYSSTSLSYSYDPAGNIRSRTGASTTTRYLYGGMGSPTFETDTSSTITLSYIQGPEGDIAHYAGPPTTGSTVTYLYQDGHGNLAATADNTGARTNNYTYDPFGAANDAVPSNTTTQRYLGRCDNNSTPPATSSNWAPALRPHPRPLHHHRPHRRAATQPLRLRRPRPNQRLRPHRNCRAGRMLEVVRPSARGSRRKCLIQRILREPRGLSRAQPRAQPYVRATALGADQRAGLQGRHGIRHSSSSLATQRQPMRGNNTQAPCQLRIGGQSLISPVRIRTGRRTSIPSFRNVQAG